MTETLFKNTRFDPDLVEFHGIAKQMAQSVGYTVDLSVDGQLAQLLRLRVAQITPCSYCLILHTRAAHDQGIAADKVAHLASWRESTMFSEAERAALAYCEALTRYDLPGFPAAHDALGAHFDERAIAEIAAIVINMNDWTRLKLAQGQVPVTEG
jgi:AhpD family alkylhydroperoxidase